MGLFSFVGSLLGAGSAKKASRKAEQATLQYLEKGIAEQGRQYDTSRADFAPFVNAGTDAVGEIGNILGLNGTTEQSTALDALKASPFYQALFGSGEEAVLQNASATGGIRGGNTQRGLADFGADTFSATIQNMLANLGGVAGMGQGAVGSVASLGANKADAITQLFGQQGAARSGGLLTRGGINSQNWNNAGAFADQAVSAFMPGGGGGGGGGGVVKSILGSIF